MAGKIFGLLGGLLVGIVAAMVVVTGGAAAATAWGSPTPIDPGNALTGISCVSAGTADFCAAVDNAGNALTWNGTTWSTASIDGSTALTSVSCASSTYCVATDTESSFIWDGTDWTELVITGAGETDSVSCPAVGWCIAVSGNDSYQLSDGSWGNVLLVNPVNLAAISCASESFCVAVSDTGSGGTYSGTDWTVPATMDAAGNMTAVSCGPGSSMYCMAVDGSGDLVTGNGTTWAETDADGSNALDAVSCASTSFCVAVDQSGRALVVNGSTTTTDTVDTSSLTGVSCPSAELCIAVDSAGDVVSYSVASLEVTTASLPEAMIGRAYDQTLGVSGGIGAPYAWSLAAGSLPGGLSLDSATGAITGTPSAAASASVTFEVADAGGYTAQQTMQFTVGQTTQTLSWPPDGEATGYVGGSWVLSGAVASSGLPVSYSVPLSSESVCVLVGSSVVFLAAGTCTVEATQAGNTTWASAGTVQQSKRVLPVPVVAATGPAPVATPGPAPLPVVGVGSSAVVRASHATLDISCAVIACSGSVALSVARRGPGGAVSHLVVASGGYSLAAGATGLVSLTMSAASRALLTRASGRTKWRVTATVVAGSVVSHDPVELVWVRKPRRMTAGHR